MSITKVTRTALVVVASLTLFTMSQNSMACGGYGPPVKWEQIPSGSYKLTYIHHTKSALDENLLNLRQGDHAKVTVNRGSMVLHLGNGMPIFLTRKITKLSSKRTRNTATSENVSLQFIEIAGNKTHLAFRFKNGTSIHLESMAEVTPIKKTK